MLKKNEFAAMQESFHENSPLLPDCSYPQYSKIIGFILRGFYLKGLCLVIKVKKTDFYVFTFS